MSSERKLIRKFKSSIDKTRNKLEKQFREISCATDVYSGNNLSTHEVWSYIVDRMSHKNLKIVSYRHAEFSKLKEAAHLIELVNLALLERAINHIDQENGP